jgi:hypothetical protein
MPVGTRVERGDVWPTSSSLLAAFSRLTAFVDRCDDVLAILDAVLAFRRLNSVLVSGASARMLQSLIDSVHSDFVDCVKRIHAGARGKAVVWVDAEPSRASLWFNTCFEAFAREVRSCIFTVYSIVSCRVVSCRVVSCRVVSCRVVSCRVVSCRAVCDRMCVVDGVPFRTPL